MYHIVYDIRAFDILVNVFVFKLVQDMHKIKIRYHLLTVSILGTHKLHNNIMNNIVYEFTIQHVHRTANYF